MVVLKGVEAVAARLAAFSIALVLAWAFAAAAAGMQAPRVMTIDAASSRVEISVGRSGVFGFAGHNHEVIAPAVSGRVSFDPADWTRSSVSVKFDASALKVTGKGDPPQDVPKVQEVMLSDQVLDVKRFPAISFESRSVSARPHGAGAFDLVIEGDLTLHGVTRPLTVRATSNLDPRGMTVRGAFAIKQTDFGMEPVTAAGGTVRTKDEVGVQFAIAAR